MISQPGSLAAQATGARWFKTFAGATVLALALTLFGCGDSETVEDTPVPAATEATKVTAGATVAATTRPSGSATATSVAGSLPARLPLLNSYRYTFKIEGTAGLIAEISNSTLPSGVNPNTGTLSFDVKGSYLKPDRGEATISFGGITVTRTVIGKQQWTRTGTIL